jgi:hypothetical protein
MARYRELVSITGLLVMYVHVCDRWIPDSPRWLIAKGYGPEAKRILEEGSVFNRRCVSVVEISPPPTERLVKISAYIHESQQG